MVIRSVIVNGLACVTRELSGLIHRNSLRRASYYSLCLLELLCFSCFCVVWVGTQGSLFLSLFKKSVKSDFLFLLSANSHSRFAMCAGCTFLKPWHSLASSFFPFTNNFSSTAPCEGMQTTFHSLPCLTAESCLSLSWKRDLMFIILCVCVCVCEMYVCVHKSVCVCVWV